MAFAVLWATETVWELAVGGESTLIVTVAVLLSSCPSLILNVKLSAPL